MLPAGGSDSLAWWWHSIWFLLTRLSTVFRPVRSLGFCASGKPVYLTKANTTLLDFSLPDNIFGLLRLISAKSREVLR